MARTTTTSRLHASCEAFNSLCEKCGDERKGLEGIFVVQPIKRSWTYDGPELKGQYSMQGMTAQPGRADLGWGGDASCRARKQKITKEDEATQSKAKQK